MIGLIQILGGLALFLFGIRMLSGGMEKIVGEQIQKWLDRMTSNRIKSAAFGTIATAMLQSSGLLMVMMIGLINANLMTVAKAIGVMLGQEIGTTLTAQIVAFDIGYYRLLLVIVGLIFIEFFEERGWKKYGEILFGLGIIFIGMSYMSKSLDELIKIGWISNGFVTMGQTPMVAVIAGLIMTAITQSSTAVTSLVVAMGMSMGPNGNPIITLSGAVGLILGANIGSCITGLIASIRLSAAAKQASFAQIFINVLGVALFLPFISQYAGFVELTSSQLPRQIANAHTIFNLIVSLALFPFVKQIAWVAEHLAPVKPSKTKPRLTAYIDEMQIKVPAVALTEAARELTRLGEASAEMLEQSCQALVGKNTELAKRVMEREDKFIDPVFKLTVDFVNKLLLQDDLTNEQKKRCFQLKNLLMDIERVGDMAEDISQYTMNRIQNNLHFSDDALVDLNRLWPNVVNTYRTALKAFETSDKNMAEVACRLESEFDLMYWEARQHHIDRLNEGICTSEAHVVFTEVLRILERVSDHADNLGVSVMRT